MTAQGVLTIETPVNRSMFFWIAWILIPLFFYFLALLDYMEARKKKYTRQNSKNLFTQAMFLSLTCVVSMLLDSFILPLLPFDDINLFIVSIIEGFVLLLPVMDIGSVKQFDSHFVSRILLFLFVALVLAKIIGPTKAILIGRAPRLHRRRKYDPLK